MARTDRPGEVVNSWHRHVSVSLDRQALYLAILFAVVQVSAIALAYDAHAGGASPTAPGGVEGTEAGVSWVVLEVAWAFLFLGMVYGWRYLPEWLQGHLKKTGKFVVLMFAGAYLAALGIFWTGLVGFIAVYSLYKLVNQGGFWWLANNAMVVGIATYVGAWIGLTLDPWPLLLAMVGFTAYDRYFADKKQWMMDMASVLVAYRIPVLFIKPARYRFEWQNILDEDGEDLEHDESAWGIGMADLLLPAAFTAAVVTSDTILLPLAVGAVVTGGVLLAALRIRKKMLTTGSGAGLPPLTAGAVGAYALAIVPLMIYNGVVA